MPVFHTRGPASGNHSHPRDSAWWGADHALLAQLEAIVADAATIGRAAQLVVTQSDGGLSVLISVPEHYALAHELAMRVLGAETTLLTTVDGGSPVRGHDGLRGALLIYGDPARAMGLDTHVLHAQAAWLETALAAAVARREMMQGAVTALWQMLAVHDRETARHAQAVSLLARAAGEALRLGAADLAELEWAAMLHDLGKIAVPPHVLHKAEPLTVDEWGLMRQHVAIGERTIRTIPGLDKVGLYVRHHHERWDGTGYPDRLTGAAIPLIARIIALVDAYETMRTGRPYQRPLTCAESRDEVRRGAGTQFDPLLLDLLPLLAGQEIGPRLPSQDVG